MLEFGTPPGLPTRVALQGSRVPLKAPMGSPGWHSLHPRVTADFTLCHWKTCHVARKSWRRRRQGLQASSRADSVAWSPASPPVWVLGGRGSPAGELWEHCVGPRNPELWRAAPTLCDRGLPSHISQVGITRESHLVGGYRGNCHEVESTQESRVLHPHVRVSVLRSEQEGDGLTFP